MDHPIKKEQALAPEATTEERQRQEKKEALRKELERQLAEVKDRLAVLDMVDERLLAMRSLARQVIDETPDTPTLDNMQKEFQNLESEVRLLSKEKNLRS